MLCWADPTEDMFTHYVPCLPFMKGHGRTCSRVISILFIWWGNIHPGSQKYPSTGQLLFRGLMSSFFFFLTWISSQTWTKSTLQWSFKFSVYLYNSQWIFFFVFKITEALLHFPLTFRETSWRRQRSQSLLSRRQWNANNVIFIFVSCTLKYPAHVSL